MEDTSLALTWVFVSHICALTAVLLFTVTRSKEVLL